MNIKEVKKIPLEDFLGRAGFSPVRRQGGQCMVPFAFQAGAYPVIQGQPFLEPVT